MGEAVKTRKATCKLAFFLGSALAALPAGEAFAESTESNAAGGIAEIVVTAERRAENIQQTPIAITAFTADSLDKLGIQNAQDLSRQSPGFSYREDSSVAGVQEFAFRGFSQANWALQPSVGVYVDGVYASTTTGSVF